MQEMSEMTRLDFPDRVVIETENGEIRFPAADPTAGARSVQLEFEEKDGAMTVWLSARDEAIRTVRLRWSGKVPADVRLLGDAWERGYGDMEWQYMSPRRFYPWYVLAQKDGRYWGYGVRVRPSAFCFWQIDPNGVTLTLDVRCGGEGVRLDGRRLEAAAILSGEIEAADSFEAARAFCGRMCTDPLLPETPVYGSNNWYYAYGDSSEAEILADTDYLMRLAEGADHPPYMVIDDCWQSNHRLGEYNGGPWRAGNTRFPDMARLAREIARRGARPGIWVRLLLNEDGAIPGDWRLPNGCLDPSHPDALAYIQEDVRQVCAWGYTLIKHDFSTFDLFGRWGFEMTPYVTRDGWHFHDRSRTSAEIVRGLYEAILEASRPYGALILGCNTIGHLGAGLMHLNRTGDDTSGLNWERTRRMGVNTLAFRLPQHGTFYHIDADCVGVTGAIPWSMNRKWAEVLAESGTPFFCSIKPGVMTAEEEEEMRGLLRRASRQDGHLRPADWDTTDCPATWVDGGRTRRYDWYGEEGAVLPNRNELFCVAMPLS